MNKQNINSLIKEGEGYNLEFKERFTKEISKDFCAFANANSGKVLLGVSDTGNLKGIKLSNKLKSEIQNIVRNIEPKLQIDIIEDKASNVIVINVPEGNEKPYSVNGSFYLRIGANTQKLSRSEIKEFFQKEGTVLFDERPDKKFDIKTDFNEEAFQKFIERSNITDYSGKIDLLNNLNLLENSYLKKAGVLLFSKEVTRFIGSASVTCVLFRGKDKYKILDRKEFNRDIFSNYIDSFNYLSSKLNTEYIIKGGPREEKLELPEKALREAILNALAHRSYFLNANIQIYIFSDRVEITDPGGLPAGITQADLGRKSMPRNTLLFGLMDKMNLIEHAGSGIRRINNEMKKYGLAPPKIEVDKNWFSMIFFRTPVDKISKKEERSEGLVEGLAEKLVEGLAASQKKILNLMAKNPYISKKELSQKIGISTTAIDKNIEKLKEKKLIKRVGSPKGGHWEIIPD